jgi:hypothetical protein
MGKQHHQKAKRSRSTGFRFEGRFDETAVEKILLAGRAQGIVTEFDTGRGRIVWFNGTPGKALRAIREKIRALVGPDEEPTCSLHGATTFWNPKTRIWQCRCGRRV